MELLRQQGVETALTVVGRPVDQAEYARIQQDPHTTCIPAQHKERLIELYRASDLFVMPSFSETFGLVYAEAMSQGLPVVYSRGQGFDGQFAEGEAGYHADPHSPAAVAEAIAAVRNDYGRIAGQTEHLAARFQWQEIVTQYQEIYRQLCRW